MNKNNLAINEMFGPTLQGEGKYVGTPCWFIRSNGCNLRCEWNNPDGTTTKCDTPYTSWEPEKKKPLSIDDIIEWYDRGLARYPNNNNIVISGGEPFIQSNLPSLIDSLKYEFNPHITVETNGTIYQSTNADLISLSPKLYSSTPDTGRERIIHSTNNKFDKSIEQFIKNSNDFQFKFVYNGFSDIEEIEDRFIDKYGLKPSDIYLMPQGIDKDQLREKSQELFNICSKRGYNYSPRLHIDVYDDLRGI